MKQIELELYIIQIMQETRTIKGTNIKYILDKDKRKNSYIQIKDGKVILKVPRSSSEIYIEQLLKEKLSWIEEKLEQYSKSSKNIKYENGAIIPVLGKKYLLEIRYSDKIKKYKLKSLENKILLDFPMQYKNVSEVESTVYLEKIFNNFYKNIAKEEVPTAMEYITHKVGLYPKDIYIKNLKATWGICSSKKYISINQNLMMFSRKAIEYVCLHEVCHLKYMNHSKDFWNMVEYYMPDYKLAKRELKE